MTAKILVSFSPDGVTAIGATEYKVYRATSKSAATSAYSTVKSITAK